MKTRWSKQATQAPALTEYPRPQFRRESYMSLNGIWRLKAEGQEYDINVPFSPECELSGVHRSFSPDCVLHYERQFTLPEGFNQGRVILHLDAVDNECRVILNGTEVASHFGGYWPVTIDITDELRDENLLTVEARDPLRSTDFYARGKQNRKRGGIWYTPQSGIWQSVWLESVPKLHIRQLRITPDYDAAKLVLVVYCDLDAGCEVLLDGQSYRGRCNRELSIPMRNFEAWSPENPKLYDFTVTVGSDTVTSYFAMRKFSVGRDKDGIQRLMLNGKPYFHNGVLDQGYWSDGMLTPPSDEAMIFDIQTIKDMGFNTLRKHIKIEPLRWYYHCDRLGMLVWQDMVNGGTEYNQMTINGPLVTNIHARDNNYRNFARESADSRALAQKEHWDTLMHLYNCPCIAMWVLFNEGWGQFDALLACARTRAIDPTRTIDHASGWHDQGGGDVKSWHTYFVPYTFRPDRQDRPVVLSEFGGYNLRTAGHCFNEKDFGYKRLGGTEQLEEALRHLYAEQVNPSKEKGLCAAIYTQLSDVEDELNGLLSYDREVIKLPVETVRDIIK